MSSVRPVRNRLGEITGYRADAKRTFDDGRQLRWGRTFPTELEAHEAGDLADADLDHDPPIHPGDRYRRDTPVPYSPGMTVGQWLELWQTRRKVTPAVARNQRGMIDNHVIPVLGWRPLAELDRDDIQSWAWGLAEDLMPRSAKTMYRILKAAVTAAIVDPRAPISMSPFVQIQMERPEATGRQALTAEQVAALARHAHYSWPADSDGDYSMIILSLVFTALRAREFTRRGRHDLTLRQTVEVRAPVLGAQDAGHESADESSAARPRPRTGKRGRTRGKATKSAAGARSVLLAPSHAAELSAYLAAHDADTLWVSSRGGPLSYETLNRIVKEATAAAVAAGEAVPPGVTAHWLRKTHRTWLSEAGVPRVMVDEQLGHETPGMVGVYEEPTEAMRRQVREVLEARWREVAGLVADGRLRRQA